MNKSVILLSKEILRPEYLSCYGGKIWKTRNIDRLAREGTKFTNFYTAAPSSGMAYTAMFGGLEPYQTDRTKHENSGKPANVETLFDMFEKIGYETHILWPPLWYHDSRKKSQVFGESTIYHNLEIDQPVGPHYFDSKKIEALESANVKEIVNNEIKSIIDKSQNGNFFLWCHFPHSFLGRAGYGSDIDIFDEIIGYVMENFDGSIFVTGDHGHMNCDKGIPVYGSHVYEGSVKIPLITPNFFDKSVVDTPLSNIQLKNIIFENKIKPQEFVIADSRYYIQDDRRLMVRKANYKYIYNKKYGTEELYDLSFDPNENVNLLIEKIYDRNRDKFYFLEEIYYYPDWETAKIFYKELKNKKNEIWKQGSFFKESLYLINNIRKRGFGSIKRRFTNLAKTKGRWASSAFLNHYYK